MTTAEKNADTTRSVPETELASVVLHAGELSDVNYLKDYIQMTKLTGELRVNEADSSGLTPLHFAVVSKKLEIVKLLVELGANVNHRDHLGVTALFWATGRYADVQVAGYLIDKGRASIHLTSNSGATALHHAALYGNLDCIALLLKNGADARCPDHDDNTPMDIAKNDAVRQLLEKSLRHLDLSAEKRGSCCELCGAEVQDLKRCGRCFVAKYCSRACQTTHWKTGGHKTSCPGYVTGHAAGSSNKGFMSLLNLNTLRLHNVLPSDPQEFASGCQKKKFIVKAQLPISASDSTMTEAARAAIMCYNEDRSMTGFVSPDAKGYDELRQRVVEGGFMGVKAFFWAELNIQANDGSFKVFHGRCAPYQTW